MVTIEHYRKKYSKILVNTSNLLLARRISPQAVLSYGLTHKHMVLIAIENKEPIGYIIGHSKSNKNAIIAIYVDPKFKNKKVGSLLLSSLIHNSSILYKKQNQQNCLWTIRLRSMDFSLVNFFKKNNFFIIERLNLYETSEIEFTNYKKFIQSKHNHFVHISETKNYNDIRSIIDIEQKSFDPYWHKTEAEWKSIMDDINAIVFIAWIKNEGSDTINIIGYNHNSVNQNKGEQEGQYIRIAVTPEYRQSGVATLLTREAFNYFKRQKVKKIFLSTIAKKKVLNDMYQHWGFRYFDSDVILGYNDERLSVPSPT